MRSSPRRRDDDDVIRARLRALLADGRQQASGWVPDEEADDPATTWPRNAPGGWDDDLRRGEEPDDDAVDHSGHDDAGHDVPGRDAVGLPTSLGRHRAPGRTARLDPGRPGAWALLAAAVLAAAVVVGWTWLDRPAVDQLPAAAPAAASMPSSPSASPSSPASAMTSGSAPDDGDVVVSVVGQVAAPGLVTLPAGSRVADALAAVGGLLPEADPASVNAASVLTDGQQIAVGVPGAAPPAGGNGPAAGGAPAAGDGGLLDLNTATVADLDALPGIGPVLAQRIVDHRTAHGPFASVDQLDDVSGIGPAIFADLSGRVRV